MSITAEEFGMHFYTVRDWAKSYKQDGASVFPGSGSLKPDDEEIRRLRRVLADLKEENEILKSSGILREELILPMDTSRLSY